MDNVESVTQLDDTRLHWVATVAGKRMEWDAKVTQQEPDQRVAWTSTTGATNAGSVDFHRIDDETTRVNLTMDIEPDGVLESVGDAVGVPSHTVKGDLDRFKSFIEGRQVAAAHACHIDLVGPLAAPSARALVVRAKIPKASASRPRAAIDSSL